MPKLIVASPFRASTTAGLGLLALWFALSTPASAEEPKYNPAIGDIIFQSLPRNAVVDAIEGATESPYSHCGIVVKTHHGWHVLQALGTVQETPLHLFLRQARDGTFDVFRLQDQYQSEIPEIISAANKYKSRPYDIRYRMDDAFIYCSELIYKAYRDATGEKLGKLVELGTLKWGAHRNTIIAIEGSLPLKRLMITPKDLAKADRLELVFKGRRTNP